MEDAAEPVGSDEQGGLADLVAVRPVLEMPDRADRQDKTSVVAAADDSGKDTDSVFGFHAFPLELAGVSLETV